MTDNGTENLLRYKPLIDDWGAFVDAGRRPLPMVLWANPLREGVLRGLNRADGLALGSGRRMLMERLERRGYRCSRLDWFAPGLRVEGLEKPGRTLEHALGLYHVQEEASLLPALFLEPRPGDRVLDLCAAPGGKTAQIALAVGRTGTVVANDVRHDRLRALRSNSERLGLLNVAVTAHDGTRFPLEAGSFDRILLDVPCSCEGNLRRGSVRRAGGFLTGRSGLQATIFGRAWKLLASGGTLVYATCTFAPEENELVLDHCLKDDGRIEEFSVDAMRQAPGVTEWGGRTLRADCAHVARYWPHLNDTGGFTVARVRKRVV